MTVLTGTATGNNTLDIVVLDKIVDGVPVDSGTAGTTFQVMQQSGGRNETAFALVTGNAPEITKRMMFQRGQMLIQVVLFDECSLGNVATVGISGVKNPLWIVGSMVLYHDMPVQRWLASKALLAYLARYPSVDLVVKMLIQSMLADEVLLAVTAPKLGGVQSLKVLDRCGFKLEDHRTFVTITMIFNTLMLFKGILLRKRLFASVTCPCEYLVETAGMLGSVVLSRAFFHLKGSFT